jgi:hypothetical protein
VNTIPYIETVDACELCPQRKYESNSTRHGKEGVRFGRKLN